jgi:hypothetical protein
VEKYANQMQFLSFDFKKEYDESNNNKKKKDK